MTARKRRFDSRRCRTILATALGAFVLAQFVGGFVISWGYPQIRFRDMHRRLAAIRLEPRTPDLVYFGSSRFGSALSASELTHELRRATGNEDFRAFDMTVPAGDIIAMERVFVSMRNSGIRPPNVVLEMAPYSLMRVNGWYSTHVIRQFDLADFPEYGLELTRSSNLGRFITARALPLYVHRYSTVKELVAPTPVPVRETVAPRNPMSDDEANHLLHSTAAPSDEFCRRLEMGLVGERRALRDYAIGGASVRALERILKLCAEDGTRVILVGAPLAAGYRELITPDIDARYLGCLDELSKRFGFTFVDCRTALPDTLMVDFHHVRWPEGTMVFTRYLGREVLGPWLQDRTSPFRLVGRNKTP